MAIDLAAIELLRLVRHELPRDPAVLEIGQANWYGDVSAESVPELAGVEGLSGMDTWQQARAFYACMLGFTVLDAVDLRGNGAWRYDLNRPLPLKRRYDVIINTGTTEHVFDQRRVFESIHDWTLPNGVMVHAFPVVGCADHGFYTYQPCLLRGLVEANGYEHIGAVRCEKGTDAMLHVAWRKVGNRNFKAPQQDGYAGSMGGRGLAPLEGEWRNMGPSGGES